jgi:hypothetical protein
VTPGDTEDSAWADVGITSVASRSVRNRSSTLFGWHGKSLTRRPPLPAACVGKLLDGIAADHARLVNVRP